MKLFYDVPGLGQSSIAVQGDDKKALKIMKKAWCPADVYQVHGCMVKEALKRVCIRSVIGVRMVPGSITLLEAPGSWGTTSTGPFLFNASPLGLSSERPLPIKVLEYKIIFYDSHNPYILSVPGGIQTMRDLAVYICDTLDLSIGLGLSELHPLFVFSGSDHVATKRLQ